MENDLTAHYDREACGFFAEAASWAACADHAPDERKQVYRNKEEECRRKGIGALESAKAAAGLRS